LAFRAEMAKAAAPYVHAKLASTDISVAKRPPDNRPIMEQWNELPGALLLGKSDPKNRTVRVPC
jgi:hypothetical protein